MCVLVCLCLGSVVNRVSLVQHTSLVFFSLFSLFSKELVFPVVHSYEELTSVGGSGGAKLNWEKSLFFFKTVERATFNCFNIQINIITKRKSKLILMSVLVYLRS